MKDKTLSRLVALGLAFSIPVGTATVPMLPHATALETANPSVKINSDSVIVEQVVEATVYNAQTRSLEIDEELLPGHVVGTDIHDRIDDLYGQLSPTETAQLLELSNINQSQLDAADSTVQTYAIPAVLIPIGKFLVGSAGAVIIAEVVQYGIAKACQNLHGRYGFFDDFCETRNYV